jgi:lipoprotein-anchoring transpeptidase ErfK/SrfK
MNNTPRRTPILLAATFTLICAALGIATAWTAASSPVLGLTVPVIPTYALPFAVVKIAKQNVTPTALQSNSLPPIVLPTEIVVVAQTDPLPTETPALIPIATETPTPLQISQPQVYAEIVVDTPAPGYSNTTQYDTPPSYGGNKYILVDISEQHMYVYEGDALVYSFVSSTGMNNATRTGYFSVLDKIPNAYGATWDIWMPNWLGIYWAGSMENGIHALPILPNGATLWAGYLGVPISYGCVVLGTNEAQILYDWADIGTPVEIRW